MCPHNLREGIRQLGTFAPLRGGKKEEENAAGSEGKKRSSSSIPKTFQTDFSFPYLGRELIFLGVRRAEQCFLFLLCGAALQFLTVKNARKAAVPCVTGIRKNLQMALCTDKRPRVTTG